MLLGMHYINIMYFYGLLVGCNLKFVHITYCYKHIYVFSVGIANKKSLSFHLMHNYSITSMFSCINEWTIIYRRG